MRVVLVKTGILSALACLLIVSDAFAQRQAPQVTTVKVTDTIYMLQGRGGNIGVSVGEDGVLIIDNDYVQMAEAIDAALNKLSKGDLKFILNTHHHADHTGGNRYFGASAPIVAHEKLRERLATSRTLGDAEGRAGLPSITFKDEISLHFNGDDIRMIHFPTGHTDNDSMVFFEQSNVLHAGDHFFVGRFPFIDLAGGGDVESYIQNVRKVIGMLPPDVKIIPGHGPLATLDDFKAFEQMLTETVGIVQKGIDAGKTLDELTEAGLPEKYADAGSGFVNEKRFIGIVHMSLTR